MSGLSRETLELISSWAEILTAAFGILAATGAVVYLLANKPLKKLEAHDNEVLKGTVADAQKALLVQQERADIAAGKLAGLEHDTADAKAEMAKQQIRAATAEKDLLELKERIKPRRLTDEESTTFVVALKALPKGMVTLGTTAGGGDEAFKFAQQLLGLFKQAGWTIPPETANFTNHLEIQVTGVGILTAGGPSSLDSTKPPPPSFVKLTPILGALRDAFKAVGINSEFINWHPQQGDVPEVVIGSKPEMKPALHKPN